MKKIVLALLPLFVLSGCERSIPDLSVNSGGRIVELWCGLPSVTAGVSSRAADLTGQVGNTNAMNLYFVRRDKGGMTTHGDYPGYESNSVVLSATRDASSGSASAKVVFANPQYYAMYAPYLTSTFKYNPSKLVGWFPKGDYNNGVVSIPMDGNTDILLSNEVEGSYDKPFNEANKLTFSHVCTLNEIKVKAVDAGAPDSWGAVTRVALDYCGGRVCEITLPNQVWFVASGSTWDIPLDLIGGPTASSPVTLVNGVAKSCGKAMVYPESVRDLIVTTEKGGERRISVDNGTEGFLAGKSYVITLEFKSVTIEPSVTISDWTPSTNNPSVDL